MHKQIYLHIGVHKTATTAIQVGLARNEKRLNHQGYHLPVQGRALGGVAHHNVLWDVRDDSRYRPEAGTLADVLDEIHQHPAQKFILSAEGFSRLEEDEVRVLCDGLNSVGHINVVIYLRRQDKLLQSMWAQVVEHGTYMPFFPDHPLALLLETYTFGDYAEILRLWESIVGKENIRVRLFDEVVQQEDILVNFLKACDVPDTNNLQQPTNANPTASVKTLEVIRAVAQRMNPDYAERGVSGRRFLWRNVRQLARANGWNDKKAHLLTEAASDLIMNHFAERNTEVARKYFNREVLFQGGFDGKPVDTFNIHTLSHDDLLTVAASLGDAYVEQVTHWQGEYYVQYADRVRLERDNRALQREANRQQQALDAIQNTRAWRVIEGYWWLRDRVKGWLGRS